jgi:uncharacterized protein
MKEYVFVVTGGFNTGKTSFVRTASDKKHVPVKFIAPENIIGQWGSIAVRGGIFHIYEPAATRRFDLMWQIFEGNHLAGYIVMLDSTSPRSFRDSKSIIEAFQIYCPAPYLVAANKQDSPEAWGVEDIKIALRIPTDLLVVPCIATDRASVANVLLTLCDKILEDGEQNQAEK